MIKVAGSRKGANGKDGDEFLLINRKTPAKVQPKRCIDSEPAGVTA